jgi:hypothetical protein
VAAGIGLPFLFSSEEALATWFVYSLVPLVVWYRYRSSKQNEVRARWPRVRNGITALYIPAVLWDCVGFVLFGLWGLVAYLIGITLLSLGYMQLAREANPSLPSHQV